MFLISMIDLKTILMDMKDGVFIEINKRGDIKVIGLRAREKIDIPGDPTGKHHEGLSLISAHPLSPMSIKQCF